VYQTDSEAKCFPLYEDNVSECPWLGDNIEWLDITNKVLVIFYSLEAFLKIYAARGRYFAFTENVLDFTICVFGCISEVVGNLIPVSWLRVFRLWRLVRIANAMSKVPEIHMLVAGLSGAIRAMFFGTAVLLVALVLCSIMIVQLIHPIAVNLTFNDCERCPRGFRTVMHSVLSLFSQIVAGDSWGLTSIPILEKSAWGILLPCVQLMIAMGITNLILAVVVDRSVEAREQNKNRIYQEKIQASNQRKVAILNTISAFDTDHSGALSRDELDRAFQESDELQQLVSVTGIGSEDLGVILEALENEVQADGSHGEVRYERLCNVIHDFESADLRKFAVVSQLSNAHQQSSIQERLQKHEDMLERILASQDRTERKIDNLMAWPAHVALLPVAKTGGPSYKSSVATEVPGESPEAARTENNQAQPRSPAHSKGPTQSTEATDWTQSGSLPDVDAERSLSRSLETIEELTRDFFERMRLPTTPLSSNDRHEELMQDLTQLTAELGHLRRDMQHQQQMLLQHLKSSLESTIVATSLAQNKLFGDASLCVSDTDPLGPDLASPTSKGNWSRNWITGNLESKRGFVNL